MIRYHARWVVPVAAAPISDGVVAVDGDTIAYVGPGAGGPAGATRDLGDVALLPGLVAAHADLGDDLSLHVAGVLDAALRAGVTTIAGCSATGAALRALRDAGLRGVVYQQVVGAAPEDRAAAFAALRDSVERLRPHESSLVRLGVAPRSAAAVHEDLLVDACAYAVAERLPLAIHVSTSADEIAFLREATGPLADALRERGVDVVRRAYSPVHLLVELGVAVVARPLLVGGALFDESDAILAATYGCPVAFAAPAGARAASASNPYAHLAAAGATIGVASAVRAHDAPVDVLADAARAVGAHPSDALSGPPLDATLAVAALHLATLGGASALGLGETVGALEAGRQADLAAFPLGGVTHDPVAALVARRPRAAFVAVAGSVRVEGGRVLAASADRPA